MYPLVCILFKGLEFVYYYQVCKGKVGCAKSMQSTKILT